MSSKPGTRRGLTLLEILIALVLLGAIVAPAWSVLSDSRRSMMTARDLSVAVSLAGSGMAALQQLEPRKLPEGKDLSDESLVTLLGNEGIALATAGEGFSRRTTLERLPVPGTRRAFLRAGILVTWQEKVSRKTFSYNLQALLPVAAVP